MPAGQPTKYREEYCEQLIKHMASGLSFESFGGVVSVNRDTIYEWAKVNPKFSDAVQEGKLKSLLYWEKMGNAGALGKIPNFNAPTWSRNMNCRHNWIEKKQVIQETSLKIDVSTKTDEELEAIIDGSS